MPPLLSYLSTKTRLRNQYELAGRHRALILGFDLEPDQVIPPGATMGGQGYPFSFADSLRILEMAVDTHFTFDADFQALLSKSQIRLGSHPGVTRTSWSPDTTALRFAHDAPVTSTLRYGLELLGQRLPDDLMNKLDSRVRHMTPLRITGLP